MFMFHQNQSMVGGAYKYGWRGIVAPTVHEVADIITRYVSSNCLWAGGERLKKNFRIAEWAGLDFDDGLTLNDALTEFKDYLHVIGTTRNHQKDKEGKGVKDRFRVFLRFSRTCRSRDDFEETTRQLGRRWGADSACWDAARFFFPCREIVSVKYHGKVIQVLDSAGIAEMREKKRQEKNSQIAEFYDHCEPGWVKSVLKYGCSAGQRNNTCYRIAHDLKTAGYSESEVVDEVMKSKLPGSRGDFTRRECESTVRSAFK